MKEAPHRLKPIEEKSGLMLEITTLFMMMVSVLDKNFDGCIENKVPLTYESDWYDVMNQSIQDWYIEIWRKD